MKGKQILFFGTASDLMPIMMDTEVQVEMDYFEMGMFDDKKFGHYNSILNIQNFCEPKFGDWNKDLRLMAVTKGANIIVRTIPQKNGTVKYAVDPLENNVSICFQFGGIYKEGILLAGSCGTAYLNDFSTKVFKAFSTLVKKKYKKIGNFFVGKDAENKLKLGWRLITNEKLAKEYDLNLD